MTKTQTHTVMDLLAEVRRMLGADELHVQAHGVSRDTIATLFIEGARATNNADGMRAELEDGLRGVVLDALRPPDKQSDMIQPTGERSPQ